MWQCPNCETANKDEKSECEVCGYSKVDGGKKPVTGKPSSSKKGFVWSHCPKCGTEYYKVYSRYCHHCGKQRE